MMLVRSTIVIVIMIFNTILFAKTLPKTTLTIASSHFDRGDFKEALSTLKTLDIHADLDNSDDMKLAFKIRAISYHAVNDEKNALETIKELLFLDPDYAFDPFDTPAQVVKLAQQQKALIEEKNKQLASVKTDNDFQAHRTNQLERGLVIERPHPVVTLFPLGINHFYLHSPTKGATYLSLQLIGLATNIGGFWWKRSYLDGFGSSHLKDESMHARFETAQVVQWVGFTTLLLSFSVSVIDALLSLKKTSAQNTTSDEITLRHAQ